MSRKTTAALIAALGINFALAGGAIMLANMNKPAEFKADDALANAYSDIKTVGGVAVDVKAGQLAVPLKAAQQGGNTRVTFTCGKKIGSGREVHEGTWDQVGGAVLYHADNGELLAIEAVFDTRSLRTDAHGLTKTVTVKEKWFDIDEHPLATFKCDQVVPAHAATSSHTHDLLGSFTLNGITQPLSIPAKLDFSGQSLAIEAQFTLLRSDYKVAKRSSTAAGTLAGAVSEVEDEVVMSVKVNASPDPALVIAELAKDLETQKEKLRVAGERIKTLEGMGARVENIEIDVDRLKRSGVAKQPEAAASNLPKKFSDRSEGYDGPYPFEMVLVPGDQSKGIAPFYMAAHEVTWGMFDKWMQAGDVDGVLSATEISKLRDLNLRPSPLYGDPTAVVQFNSKDNPAMAMSLVTARAYCKWLSEKTGRAYRLPTRAEWDHALKLGGGVPKDLGKVAWHTENSPLKESNLMPLTSAVAKKKPNAIGIYDMLGSVAEWVTDTGDDRMVVGGSVFTNPSDFAADWHKIEDVAVWSANYPNDPKSRFWYSDYYFTGIRLVCEPASVAANPPKEK